MKIALTVNFIASILAVALLVNSFKDGNSTTIALFSAASTINICFFFINLKDIKS